MKHLPVVLILLFTLQACNSPEQKHQKKQQDSADDVGAHIATANHDDASTTKRPEKELIEDFIPKGWRVIEHVGGDLNSDGTDDAVIVIENTDPANFKISNGMGPDTLNLNPRKLMVFFKVKNGYSLVVQNDKGFVPTANDESSPCLSDPLQEGHISIEKGLLHIHFQYWLSCGSWYVNNASYKFRYQQGGMVLIGFDHSEFHRSSGETSSTSINYLTKKKAETTGGNRFEDGKNKPKTKWSTVDGKKLYRLEDCTSNTYVEILEI